MGRERFYEPVTHPEVSLLIQCNKFGCLAWPVQMRRKSLVLTAQEMSGVTAKTTRRYCCIFGPRPRPPLRLITSTAPEVGVQLHQRKTYCQTHKHTSDRQSQLSVRFSEARLEARCLQSFGEAIEVRVHHILHMTPSRLLLPILKLRHT